MHFSVKYLTAHQTPYQIGMAPVAAYLPSRFVLYEIHTGPREKVKEYLYKKSPVRQCIKCVAILCIVCQVYLNFILYPGRVSTFVYVLFMFCFTYVSQ